MSDPEDPLSVLEEVVTAVGSGERVVLATVVETADATPTHGGARMLVYPDGRCSGTIGGGALEARVTADALETIATGHGRLAQYDLEELGMCPGDLTVYLEPQLPRETIVVVGCGHVGRAVAELAHWLGFRVVAVDDRPEQLADKLLPGVDERAETLAQVALTSSTDVVLTTRSTEIDLDVLPLLLATDTRSIGVLGSRRRWARTKAALLERGVSAGDLERVRTPIGLDLGARTPHEIAVSILAELIASRDRAA